MDSKSRIKSILKANSLDFSVSDMPTFDLAKLDLATDIEFQLPTNLRLGHMVEFIVAQLLKSSTNFKLLLENVQVMEGNSTIGEIDFIIEDLITKQIIHLELAYKFYLYDPSLSSEPINNWIGPNRNDSLKEKLEKLKSKQFPLLYHQAAPAHFKNIAIDKVSQALCFLVSLYVPYQYKASFSPVYARAIKGYYLNFETFIGLGHSTKLYYLPTKKEWGMEPAENEIWTSFNGVEKHISTSLKDKRALLCWQKCEAAYSSFFIVWW